MFEKNCEVMALLELTPGEKLVTISDASIVGFLLDSWRASFKLRGIVIDVVIDCALFTRVSSIFFMPEWA